MRLADDPLLLHMFLVRADDTRLSMLPQHRRELILPADMAARGSTRPASHLFTYRMAALRDPPSLSPEPFCPSEGDWAAAPEVPFLACEARTASCFVLIAVGLLVASLLVLLA